MAPKTDLTIRRRETTTMFHEHTLRIPRLLSTLLALGLVALGGCDEPSVADVDGDGELDLAPIESAGIDAEFGASSSAYVHAYLAAVEDLHPGRTAALDPDRLAPEELLGLLSPEEEQSEEFQAAMGEYLDNGQTLADISPSSCPPWYHFYCAGMYGNTQVQYCDGGIKCISKTRPGHVCQEYANPCVSCWYTTECL